MVVFFFFFQAEDGIRDLVRSRGLGDVYKKVEIVPPKRVVKIRRIQIKRKLSLLGIVKIATIVIKLASPSFAPGAKAKGDGNIFSIKPKITP